MLSPWWADFNTGSNETDNRRQKDTTYTPPDIPAHISARLEPVVGPPSDQQVHRAHAALCASEALAAGRRHAPVVESELPTDGTLQYH
jgi:hypothetical protein